MVNQKRPGHFWEKKVPAKNGSANQAEAKPAPAKPAPAPIKVDPNRIPTGVVEFDKLIEGGLKKNSITLVEGGSGTGKSIFCTQFLMEGIKNNENGIYINFEEDKEEFYENMKRFGWDLEKLELENKFAFIKHAPEQVEKLMDAGGGMIRDVMDRVNAKRVVIDSLSSYMLLHKREMEVRDSLLLLFKTLKKWKVTSLVAGGPYEDQDKHPYNIADYEVDGVVRLYNRREHKIRARTLEVFKMRGTKHSQKTFSFEITDRGIVVYPGE